MDNTQHHRVELQYQSQCIELSSPRKFARPDVTPNGKYDIFLNASRTGATQTAALEDAGIARPPATNGRSSKNRRNQRTAARPSADFNSDIRVSLLTVAEVMPQRPVSHNVQHGGGAQAQQGHEQESGFAHDRLRGEIFAYCSAAK